MNALQFQASLGTFVVAWNESGRILRNEWYPLVLTQGRRTGVWTARGDSPIPETIQELVPQLQSYFECGSPLDASVLDAVEQSAWSEFQYRVYRCIASIPHGETRTYAWVASRLGTPGATRAVGQALRWNPVPILVPCHRVVASGAASSTRALGGFMGQSDALKPELQLKRGLLALECEYVNPLFPFLEPALEKVS